MQTLGFTAEIKQLLDLVIHSIYSNKEIFLRELISNSSDAIDKIKLIGLSSSNSKIDSNFQITVSVDRNNKLLTIEDNGIGMNKDDCINNLGTIAKSGTKEFMKSIQEAKDKTNLGLIGQFGVGFYSGFMIAKKISVISKRYDTNQICVWSSDGSNQYTVEEFDSSNLDEFEAKYGQKYNIHFNLSEPNNVENTSDPETASETKSKYHGTKVILEVKEDLEEFLDQFRIKNIVKTYSDNISYPICYYDIHSKNLARINATTAIWLKNKSEITDEEYKTFYKEISHDHSPYIDLLHNKNEGKIDFVNLIFLPSKKSHDSYHPDRISKLKLYINRVFITDSNITLVPKYLRFIRGIVDCPSLPLNISRETLQDNPMIQIIKDSLEKKVLSKLDSMKKQKHEEYVPFWENFGPMIKEGLCEHGSKHEDILKISLFYSAKQQKMISLDEYIDSQIKNGEAEGELSNDGSSNNESSHNESNNKDQNTTKDIDKKIYYVVGEEPGDLEFLSKSSHVEGLLAKGNDVLIMVDSVDSFWTTVVRSYKDFEFTAATKKDKVESSEQNKSELCKYFEKVLEKYNVIVSSSSTMESSYARLVDDAMMSMSMEKFLLKNSQKLNQPIKKMMEINENHLYIQKINNLIESNPKAAEDLTKMTFFQACIAENYNIDKLEFNSVLARIAQLI